MNPIEIIGLGRDVTTQNIALEKLQESERSKSVLLANLPGMAYRCNYDRSWTMQYVSEGCLGLTGYRPESLIYNRDISYNDIISPEFREYLWDTWKRALSLKLHFREEYTIITANREVKWVLEQGQGIYNDNGEVEALEGLIIDITDQKEKQEEIRYLSYHDGLTGLYNRIYFEQEKKRLDKEAYLPLTVMIGDINGLKMLNDAFGHAEGDQLIIETANVIRSCCGKEAIVARTGGDEFTIMFPNTGSEAAYKILKSIQQACEDFNSYTFNDAYHINISLGYATKEKPDDDFDRIQKLAEDYMYKRKLLDRNSSHSALLSSIKSTMYAKSEETEQHAERLQRLARLLGARLNLSDNELDELSLLATLHDIGKVGISDKILKKPGKLNDEEWMEMKKHPEIGYRIAMATPELMSIANYILCHHERWDGRGYPQALKGESIPMLSRIIAVVDSYDAMTQDRPYRKAMSKTIALNEIQDCAGTQFDPKVAMAFIDMFINVDEYHKDLMED
jgi:diguanylate cyclase (GGDEF)-like protein/PAS domain S-box-containing protein